MFDPYGELKFTEPFAAHAPVRMGRQGLFFERTDAPQGSPHLSEGAEGLYFNRGRWYSARTGRFLQPDPNATAMPLIEAMAFNGQPVGAPLAAFALDTMYGDGMNLYAYAGSNPVNRSDPSGLFYQGLNPANGLNPGQPGGSAYQSAAYREPDAFDLIVDDFIIADAVSKAAFMSSICAGFDAAAHIAFQVAQLHPAVGLAVAANKIANGNGDWSDWLEVGMSAVALPLGVAILAIVSIVQPKTIQRWLREARKHTRPRRHKRRRPGRPRTPEDIRAVITLKNTQQTWTLDQTGNWELFKNDLNGDNDWADANELNDDRTHNQVNELTARDTDDNGSDNYSLSYTAAGQLSDDGEHYEYIYDAWGRLVEIENQSSVTVAAFEYNGLGHRIGHQWDKDADNDLDWQWLAYDDRWRVVARYEDASATNAPFEQVYHHHAGLAGYGNSSYIDAVIARDRDTNTGSSGFETREYVLQNWRADVVALPAPDGDLLERITYDAYGDPFATHPTDLTHGTTGGVVGYGSPNGTVDASDYTYFLALHGGSNFRADWNRDGTLDAADNTAYTNDKNAATGTWGRSVLSNSGNILGYAGYVHEPATGAAGAGHGTMWHVRHRVLHSGLGRWVQRDPLHYPDGPNQHQYAIGMPIVMRDERGQSCAPTCPCTDWRLAAPLTNASGEVLVPNPGWQPLRAPWFDPSTGLCTQPWAAGAMLFRDCERGWGPTQILDYDENNWVDATFPPCNRSWFNIQGDCEIGKCWRNTPPKKAIVPPLGDPYTPYGPLPEPIYTDPLPVPRLPGTAIPQLPVPFPGWWWPFTKRFL